MAEVEAPPAETRVTPQVPREAAPLAEPAAIPEPRRSLRARLGARVPETLARHWRALAAWTHTPRALRLGSGVLMLMALAAVASLILIGVYGRGTYQPYRIVDQGSGSVTYGPLPPDDASLMAPGLLAPARPPDLAVSSGLSGMVLQQADVPAGLQSADHGPTGSDSANGLLGSYHAVFNRDPSAGPPPPGQEVAIFSLVGAYTDALSASHNLDDLAIERLGLEAGLPQLDSSPVVVAAIGDERRAVHLTGQSGSVAIGAYVIQFRKGPLDAIVGVVWPLGQESLDEVVRLASLQSEHLTVPAEPVAAPESLPPFPLLP